MKASSLRRVLSSKWLPWVLPALLIAGYWGIPKAAGPVVQAVSAPKVMSLSEALKQPLGTPVTCEFQVGSGKYLGPKIGTLLNEGIYPNHSGTVHLASLADPAPFLGRKVTVKGTVASYKGKPQIEGTEIN
jgi:hypothetical protein